MTSRNFVFGLLASVVAVAVALGILAWAGAAGDDRLDLPDRVGDLVATDTDAAYPDGADPEIAGRQRENGEFNAAGYSDAFDGAAAGARTYVTPGAEDYEPFNVVAVASDAGPLVPGQGFVDPAVLGLALPMVERTVDGDVECLLTRSQPPRAGTDYQPDEAEPDFVTCQRRSGHLTVRVAAVTGDAGRVTGVVQDVWDELD